MKLESFRYELAVAETLEQIKLLDTKAAAIAEIARKEKLGKEKQDEIGLFRLEIEQKHYNHYKQVQEMTGLDVFLFFNHKEKQPIGLYFCKLDEYTRVWDGSAKGKQVHPPMVFYNIEVLKKVL